MADRVELQFRAAAARLIPDGTPVIAAVSGGCDSTALLYLLARRASRDRGDLSVAHLDHGLRRGSVGDRRFVERLARKLGLRCISDRRDVNRLRDRNESPEEAARRVRRAFMIEAAREAGAELVATGHTLDDQAETVLMRLVRGAGATALTGMAERGPGPFVRPLLALERADLLSYLGRRELAWREDPSNRDLRFDRNRVRRLVMPLLVRTLNPRAPARVVRAAGRFREDALLLDEIAGREAERLVAVGRAGSATLDVLGLRELPLPLAKRVARIALKRAGADLRRVSARHVEALVDLATGPGGRENHLPGRLVARRRGGTITIRREN